jgi:hypothetical protein
MTIVTLVVAATVSLCWTRLSFYFEPMTLYNVDNGSIDWPYVLLVFALNFVAVFCGGVLFGSVSLIAVKLFRWLRRRQQGFHELRKIGVPGFKIMTIVTFVIAAAVSLCWTRFCFYLHPMTLYNVDNGSINWPYVLLVFALNFVAVFCVGVLFGSVSLITVKLFRWLRRRISGS